MNDVVFKNSLAKFKKENVSLNEVLEETKHLYFNDKELTVSQRDKIKRILETIFE